MLARKAEDFPCFAPSLAREPLSNPDKSAGEFIQPVDRPVEIDMATLHGGLPLANTHVRKGKVAELRLELNSGGKKDKNHSAKKIALKKIVANMTMSNNDMVALFPDVVGCMQIPSLEIKKMYVLTGLTMS